MTPSTSIANSASGSALTAGLPKWLYNSLTIAFGIFLLAGIWNGYRMCAYGMNFSDEPFHIINAMDYKNAPLTVLNAYIGHIFGNTFGWEYINFRYLAWTFDLLSILIAGSFLFWKTRILLISLGFTSLVVFYDSVSPLIFRLYGWDCLVALILSIILCATLYYNYKPSLSLLLVISFLTSASILIKIPTILLVPIIAMFIIWRFRKIREAVIFSFIAIAVPLCGILLFYGNINEYVHYLLINSNSGHNSIIGLIAVEVFDFGRIIPSVCLFAFLFISVDKFSRYKKWIVASAVILCIFCLYIVYQANFTIFGSEFRLLPVAVTMAAILSLATKDITTALLIFALSFICSFGSDRGLIKFMSCPSLIICISYIYNPIQQKSIAISSLILFISLTYFRYSKAYASSFNDAGLPYLSETIQAPSKLKGMRTCEERVSLINKTLNTVGNNNTFVVGDSVNKYMYEYLFDNINPYLRQGFGTKNNFEKQKYVDSVSAHISRAPIGMQYLYLSTDTTTIMYRMLDERMPERRSNDYAIIFIKR